MTAPDAMNTSSLARLVSETKQRIQNAPRISLFLDFDGTLVPIEADPKAPRLDERTASTLRLMASLDSVVTTIISGRAVEDLYTRVRLEDLVYAGNHGLEIFGRNLRFVAPEASAAREQLAHLCEDIRERLESVAGAMVEFKGLTASVHYRKTAVEDRQMVEDTVRALVSRSGGLFRLNPGRKVFEIMPRSGWHKGMAVCWINRQLSQQHGEEILSIYVGDDTSDEDAFSVMPDAITIKVGNAPLTLASYQLPDPKSVHEFLLWLAFQKATQARRG
jgi:trehalose 6-phosphate phosphatase